MSMRSALGLIALLAALIALGAARPPAVHGQTTATSSAFGESVNLHFDPLIGATVDVVSAAQPLAQGTAPPSYDQNLSTASVSVSGAAPVGQVLSTGILLSHATANVPNNDSASADATVNNLSLNVLSLLGIGANVVTSSAAVSGTCGGTLTRTGSTTIVSGTVGGTLGVGSSIATTPSPNLNLINLPLLGVKVVLNEQIATGDGTTSAGLTVNAIHVTFNNYILGAVDALTADIIVGQSTASITCGPLPTATPTGTATATWTHPPIPPTATRTPTNTLPPPTSTATRTVTATPTDTPCSPAPSAVTSSAFGESIRLTLLGGAVSLASGPTPTTAGTAGAPYDDMHQLAAAQLSSAPIGPILDTGLLIAHAASDGPSTGAGADATVNDLDLDITALLGLAATTVRSEASLSGCLGDLDILGETTIESATLSGVLAGSVIALHPAPNTVLIDELGIRILLNEQLTTPTSLTVNAIHIVLDNYLLGTAGLVSADIVIAQSAVGLPSGAFPTASATPTHTATAIAPTATQTATHTGVPPTATATATHTAIPPSATRTNTPPPPTATSTAVPPTATRTASGTAVPPTATRTATNTAMPPTATRTGTSTALPPTATRTATHTVPPPSATRTPTSTAAPPTATRTHTPAPATATRTNTALPPTVTRTATRTPLPPTATRTATFAPGTATQSATQTALAPTATRTAVPPTATRTSTSTPLSPPATRTATFAPGTATKTATHTPVPPTATRTNTPPPPTATHTAGNTMVSSTATPTANVTVVAPTATETVAVIPPTATQTATDTAIPPTVTQTPSATTVPPTAAETNTPLPPSATGTATATPTVTLTPTPSATYTPTPCTAPLVSSSAFGEMVDLDVGPIDGEPFTLASARSPLVSGSAPPSYDLGGALPVAAMSHPMTGELLRTEEASVSAAGEVGEVALAAARCDVDAAQLHITELSNLLSLRASGITSTAAVEGTCCTGFTASGSTSFAQGSLDCLIGAGLPIDPSPAPNTTILDGAGMRIVLNEQIIEGDAHAQLGLTVNAVHIHLDDLLVTGLGALRGDIYLGQSKASLDCGGRSGGVTCLGDCDRNGTVAVHELVLAVSIALGKLPMSSCDAIDGNPLDGRAAINELVEAVGNALYGCPHG